MPNPDPPSPPDPSAASRAAPGGATDRPERPTPSDESAHPAIAQAHEVAARARSLQRAVGELADVTPTPEERAARAVDEAMRTLGASAAVGAQLVDGGAHGATLELTGAIGVPDDLLQVHRRLPLDAPLPLCEAARTGRGVFCGTRADVLRAYPEMAPVLERLGAHALCAVPVRHLGRVAGALGLAFPGPRRFGRDERSQLQVFGARYARGLHEARLYFAERRLRAEADAARRDAEAADQAKTRALQVVTHDLRSPLQAVLGYADLIAAEAAGPVTELQRHYLTRLRAAGTHLLDLMEDLLAAAQPAGAGDAVDLDEFPVAALCEEVTAVAEPLAARQGLAFRCALAAGAPAVVVLSDRRKLRQALVNLVVNAIKFTPSGAVTIAADVVTAPPGDGLPGTPLAELLEFRVTDTGIGIAPEHLDRIFDPFWQVPGARAPGGIEGERGSPDEPSAHAGAGSSAAGAGPSRGVGLGLSIARRYVERLGGTLTVTSRVGAGSTFTVRVPRRAGAGEQARGGHVE